MPYTKQTWADGSAGNTPVSATRLAYMENGIADADSNVLTPTPVKAVNYTAQPGEFVPFDASGAARTLTLPSTPADKTVVGTKLVVGGNNVTITAGGTDRLNIAGTGPTTASLSSLNQVLMLQYSASLGVWYETSYAFTLAALQSMFLAAGAVIDLSTLSGLTTSAAGTGVGDKLALYGGAGGYGFGIQAARMVAYLGSAGAFAVRAISGSGQKSSGTDILYIDTLGHLVYGSGAPGTPAAAYGAGAGTTPPALVVVAASKDARGAVTWGTGTAPAAGAQVTVTFANAYASAPNVQISETTGATAALAPYVSAVTTTGFTVSFNSAPGVSQANTVYGISWQAVG